MYKDAATTELLPVMTAKTPSGMDVWLNRNIEHVDDEWTADGTSGKVPHGISADEIANNFDYYWEKFEQEAMSEREIIEKMQAQVWFTAVMTDTYIGDDDE